MITLERPNLRTTWLPLGLAVIALILLNLGLYFQLGAQSIQPRFEIPYYEDFSTFSINDYQAFGGNWTIRDESLVQLSTSGYDLMTFVPIGIEASQPYFVETTLRFLGGSMGGGLIFNAQQTTSRQQSHMVRFNVDGGQLWLIYGYFADDSDFRGQGSALLNIAPDDTAPRQLRVQVKEATYAVWVDNTLVADDVPLIYEGGAVGFISATSQIAFDYVRVDTALGVTDETVTASPDPSPITDNAVPNADNFSSVFADTFEGTGGESLWRPISGVWRFADGTYKQTETAGFDLSTIYQQAFTYPVRIVATFEHEQGAGGGILFNLPMPDAKTGGHMVRYFEEGNVIAWGYFDDNGVFNGQGSVIVPAPETNSQTLEVRASAQTYTIALNGAELASNIPIVNASIPAYVGLTASQSAVNFQSINVDTDSNETSFTPTSIDVETARGDWLVEGGVVQQTATDNNDYVAGIGLAGEKFIISTDITLPLNNQDAGGGIIFHMDGRDEPRLGYMVRFGSGGRELFWGRYDEGGVFTGEGGIPMNLTQGEPHQLLLIVRDNNFDIQVNNETVVANIPIQRSSGWIGLVSFSGVVTFTNVNLQLGE